jgi:hypothetical protein
MHQTHTAYFAMSSSFETQPQNSSIYSVPNLELADHLSDYLSNPSPLHLGYDFLIQQEMTVVTALLHKSQGNRCGLPLGS